MTDIEIPAEQSIKWDNPFQLIAYLLMKVRHSLEEQP